MTPAEKTWRIFLVPLLLAFLAGATPLRAAPQMVVLRTIGSGTPTVEGPLSLADRPACPASTFKVLIAWAALEEKIASPGRLIRCADSFIASVPRLLDLHHALVLSSNDYFRPLVRELGWERLEHWIEKGGLASERFPANRIGRDPGEAVHGGNLRVSPRAMHGLMRKIADATLASRADLGEALAGALEWPSPESGLRIFGKTGVFGGGVWFTGFGERNGVRTTVTVFRKGTIADRPAVIARFYRAFGVSWAPGLLAGW